MTSNAEKVMTSMGSLEMADLSTPIEDRHLRHALISVSKAIEVGVEEGKYALDTTIKKVMPFGLEVMVSMTRPRQDKPIVFKYQYRVNRATYQAWVKEHEYMFGGDAVGWKSLGITVLIPGPGIEKYHKTSFTVVRGYGEDFDNELPLDLLNQTATFVVHREVVSEHEWIVKAHQN